MQSAGRSNARACAARGETGPWVWVLTFRCELRFKVSIFSCRLSASESRILGCGCTDMVVSRKQHSMSRHLRTCNLLLDAFALCESGAAKPRGVLPQVALSLGISLNPKPSCDLNSAELLRRRAPSVAASRSLRYPLFRVSTSLKRFQRFRLLFGLRGFGIRLRV